jgi:hypothetical protein
MACSRCMRASYAALRRTRSRRGTPLQIGSWGAASTTPLSQSHNTPHFDARTVCNHLQLPLIICLWCATSCANPPSCSASATCFPANANANTTRRIDQQRPTIHWPAIAIHYHNDTWSQEWSHSGWESSRSLPPGYKSISPADRRDHKT